MKTPEYIQKLLPGTHIEVYATVVNSDGTEGRGNDVDLAYFWTSTEALKYGRKKNVQGTDGDVLRRSCIVGIDGKLYLTQKPINVSVDEAEQKRLAALEKARSALSREELKLLGIDQ